MKPPTPIDSFLNASVLWLVRRALPIVCLALLSVSSTQISRADGADNSELPSTLIPRRSSQIHDGFGINSNLPRALYIPSNRWWWTRMFDAGVNFIRIGQYENSSDYTSWDWVERKK